MLLINSILLILNNLYFNCLCYYKYDYNYYVDDLLLYLRIIEKET